jgi:hypothetical protein
VSRIKLGRRRSETSFALSLFCYAVWIEKPFPICLLGQIIQEYYFRSISSIYIMLIENNIRFVVVILLGRSRHITLAQQTRSPGAFSSKLELSI